MADASKQFHLMTETPVTRLIIKLSIPTIISMLGTTIYNLVDTAFVGKLGTSQSGAVGVVFGFMTVLQAIGFMCGQGSGSIASRRLGEQNIEEATRIASTGFFTSFSLGLIVLIFGIFNMEWLVYFFGSTTTIAPYAKTYLYFILSTAPLAVSTFTLNNILRYEGKALFGMIGILTGGILNIAGDAIFMFGFDMGIAGAGLSTAISQVISFCILLGIFLAGKTQTKISIRSVSFFSRRQYEVITTGLPSLVRQALGGVSTIFLNQSAAVCSGDAGIAALSIVSRVAFAIFAIALGIGQGFQPICAFNYGAKKYSRVRSAYKYTILFAECVLLVLTVLALIFPNEIVRRFRDDPAVIVIGVRALRLLCLAQFFMPFCMVTEMMLQSTGKKFLALFLSTLRGGLLYIPLILILGHFRGIRGLQEAQPLAYILSAIPGIICAIIYFRNLPKNDAI